MKVHSLLVLFLMVSYIEIHADVVIVESSPNNPVPYENTTNHSNLYHSRSRNNKLLGTFSYNGDHKGYEDIQPNGNAGYFQQGYYMHIQSSPSNPVPYEKTTHHSKKYHSHYKKATYRGTFRHS